MIEIRKSRIWDVWMWSCPVCHYGMDVPWEQVSNWHTALAETMAHLEQHHIVGKRSDWAPLRIES